MKEEEEEDDPKGRSSITSWCPCTLSDREERRTSGGQASHQSEVKSSDLVTSIARSKVSLGQGSFSVENVSTHS